MNLDNVSDLAGYAKSIGSTPGGLQAQVKKAREAGELKPVATFGNVAVYNIVDLQAMTEKYGRKAKPKMVHPDQHKELQDLHSRAASEAAQHSLAIDHLNEMIDRLLSERIIMTAQLEEMTRIASHVELNSDGSMSFA